MGVKRKDLTVLQAHKNLCLAVLERSYRDLDDKIDNVKIEANEFFTNKEFTTWTEILSVDDSEIMKRYYELKSGKIKIDDFIGFGNSMRRR